MVTQAKRIREEAALNIPPLKGYASNELMSLRPLILYLASWVPEEGSYLRALSVGRGLRGISYLALPC